MRDERPLTEHVHLAFPADADATVRAFHAAALAVGYEDHGAPGERAVYHPGYYGAFVLDPDGRNFELVNQPLSHGRRVRPTTSRPRAWRRSRPSCARSRPRLAARLPSASAPRAKCRRSSHALSTGTSHGRPIS